MSADGFHENGPGLFTAGSVFGVRTWTLTGEGMLRGSNWYVWKDGDNQAVCSNDRTHQPPVDFDYYKSPANLQPAGFTYRCGCGFWAYWQRAHAPIYDPENAIIGVIEGDGKVIGGPLGFRSARARIVALAIDHENLIPAGGGQRRWTPHPNMFRRGPAGAATFEALTGHAVTQRLVPSPDTDLVKAEIEDKLSRHYPSAAIYTTPEIMLRLRPTSAEYAQSPHSAKTITHR